MTSQHFGSLRLKEREQKRARADRNRKTVSYVYIHMNFFFQILPIDIIGLVRRGEFCWIVSRFVFPVEEHCCNAATVNLLRTVRALKTLPSALREGIWTHLSRAVVKCKPSVLKNLPVLANIIYQPGRQAVVNYTWIQKLECVRPCKYTHNIVIYHHYSTV